MMRKSKVTHWSFYSLNSNGFYRLNLMYSWRVSYRFWYFSVMFAVDIFRQGMRVWRIEQAVISDEPLLLWREAYDWKIRMNPKCRNSCYSRCTSLLNDYICVCLSLNVLFLSIYVACACVISFPYHQQRKKSKKRKRRKNLLHMFGW